MAYFIGIDIGTSGTKTVLFDHHGTMVASSTYEYPLYQPRIGWAEQDPEDWWKGVCVTVGAVIRDSGVSPVKILGLGLSGQMHGLVLLDREGNVLRRSIIWCDQRTDRECGEITDLIGRDRLVEITANPALTGFTASKIQWVKNNQPELYRKTWKILLPKDYIRYRLTGEFATEVSDASGMQLLDVSRRQWSTEILDKLEIREALLGRVYESCEATGRITGEAARATGLAEGTVVAGGAGDQAAGAVGNGIVKPGILSSTIGTSGVVFAHSDQVQIDREGRVHTFCHAVPGCWHIMGVTQGAGLSLKWFRDQFCLEEIRTAQLMGVDPYVLMDREAERIPAGSEGVIYLPYLMGERTPHLDPYARGVFFGLSAAHNKAHLIRAVMEGVVYSLRDCLDIIRGMGISVLEIRASGGGSRSTLWRQMQADVFGTDMVTVSNSEGPALGAAILAGVASGVFSDVKTACMDMIRVTGRQTPHEETRTVYQKQVRIYRNLYPSLKQQFRALKEMGEP